MNTNDLADDRVARVKRYWKAAAEQDHATIGDLVSSDVFRSGPLNSTVDDVKGRELYCEYVRKIQEHLSTYRNVTHDLLASPDGRRAYLHCTEWDGVGGTEIEVPMILVFDFNDAGLMTKIDIFWKSTADAAQYGQFVQFLSSFKV